MFQGPLSFQITILFQFECKKNIQQSYLMCKLCSYINNNALEYGLQSGQWWSRHKDMKSIDVLAESEAYWVLCYTKRIIRLKPSPLLFRFAFSSFFLFNKTLSFVMFYNKLCIFTSSQFPVCLKRIKVHNTHVIITGRKGGWV